MLRALPILLLTLLAGCSMAASSLIDDHRDMSCTHDGGTYYLARTVVKVVIHERKDLAEETETGGYVMEELSARADQDRRFPYCLDFLRASTSDDVLVVSRSTELLLNKISSTADDKSKDIAQSLIRAIFIGLTRDPKFGTARSGGLAARIGSTKVFETEFDPFDPDQAALVNESLRRFGFCVLVENREFLAGGRSADELCDGAVRGARRIEQRILAASLDKSAERPRPFAQGVFYRPRLPYNFMVMVKKNRQVAGGWQLRGSKSVLFENESPVFSVGVDRTYFAKRSTTLDFDQGALRDARIEKGSEMLGFVQIPLTIAQSIAAVPGSILQVRIDDTNNRHKLIQAQQDLLTSHRNYLESLKAYHAVDSASEVKTYHVADPGGLPFVPRSAGLPGSWDAAVVQTTAAAQGGLSQCMADCSKDPASAPYCPQFCQCRATQCPSSGDAAACDTYCSGLLKQTN